MKLYKIKWFWFILRYFSGIYLVCVYIPGKIRPSHLMNTIRMRRRLKQFARSSASFFRNLACSHFIGLVAMSSQYGNVWNHYPLRRYKTRFKRAVLIYTHFLTTLHKQIAVVNHYHPMLSSSLVAARGLQLQMAEVGSRYRY